MAGKNGTPVTRGELRQTLRAEIARHPAIRTLKADVRTLKADVRTLKAEVVLLNSSARRLESDVGELKADVARLNDTTLRLLIDSVKANERMDRIERTMATKEDVNRILNSLDSLTTTYTASWKKQIVQDERHRKAEERIDRHERRIAALEAGAARR